jgi:hypothetical protein
MVNNSVTDEEFQGVFKRKGKSVQVFLNLRGSSSTSKAGTEKSH